MAKSNYPNDTVLTRDLQAYLRWRNTPATPTSWPPNAANGPGSAARRVTAEAGSNPRSLRRPDPANVHG